MGGKNRPDDVRERAERKVVKAQMRLRLAEEQHVQARARGKRAVEKARLKAARWVGESAAEVEAAMARLARAQLKLSELHEQAAAKEGQVDESAPASNEHADSNGAGGVAELGAIGEVSW